MPICIFLVPEGASQEAKLALMGRLSSHIHEAHPVTTTHIFMHEAYGSNVMLAGLLVSELPRVDAMARGARVCFLICPPGVKADAKKTMMEKLTVDISGVYLGADDVFIIHREDELGSVMLNGRLQSESPKFRETTPACGEGMKTKTIQQTIRFKAAPQAVYQLLLNSKKHSSLSGERAVISTKVSGKFTAWNGHITGFNLVLKPGAKIVQAWRATGWWPDHYSIAIFDIQKSKGGSVLHFTQIGVPPNRYSGHYRGWIEAYWTPMKEVLASGKISERTRARVKAARERRIRTRSFRRKLTRDG